jgi:hypothetical protein
MEKFIYIPVDGYGNQMVSATNVMFVYEEGVGATQTVIYYVNGGTVVLTHEADPSYIIKDAIQDAVKAALQTSWTNVAPVTVSTGLEFTDISNALPA